MVVAQIEKDGIKHDVPAVVINAKKMGLLDTPNPLLVVSISSPKEGTSIASVQIDSLYQLMFQRFSALKDDSLGVDEIIVPVTESEELADLAKEKNLAVLRPTGRVKTLEKDDYLFIYAVSGERKIAIDGSGNWSIRNGQNYQQRTAEVRNVADFIHQNQEAPKKEKSYAEKEMVSLKDLGAENGVELDFKEMGYLAPMEVVGSTGKNFPGLDSMSKQGEFFYLDGKKAEGEFAGANFSANVSVLVVPDKTIYPGHRTYLVIRTDNATYPADMQAPRIPKFNPQEVNLEIKGAGDNFLAQHYLDPAQMEAWQKEGSSALFFVLTDETLTKRDLKGESIPVNVISLAHTGSHSLSTLGDMKLTLKDGDRELSFDIENTRGVKSF